MTDKLSRDPICVKMLARASAGHDRDKVYVVLREENGYLFLADGKTRTLLKPKKKKRIHVQIITHAFADLSLPEEDLAVTRDEDIRRILKAYRTSWDKV